jgi:hypothetical protein
MAETTDRITSARGATALAADPFAPLLPNPEMLTEPQIRGRDCVWCAVTLGAGFAIDLGERSASFYGTVARWFPRGPVPSGTSIRRSSTTRRTARGAPTTRRPALTARGCDS